LNGILAWGVQVTTQQVYSGAAYYLGDSTIESWCALGKNIGECERLAMAARVVRDA
jgi:hypothetical protein